MPGRYGPYVKWEKVNATLPKELAPEALTLEQALELIAAKRAGKEEAAPRKAAAKKPPRRRQGGAEVPAGARRAPRRRLSDQRQTSHGRFYCASSRAP